MSGTDQYNKKIVKHAINYNPPTFGEIKLVNFGPLTKKLSALILIHSGGLFLETTFWPLGGAAASNLYTRYNYN